MRQRSRACSSRCSCPAPACCKCMQAARCAHHACALGPESDCVLWWLQMKTTFVTLKVRPSAACNACVQHPASLSSDRRAAHTDHSDLLHAALVCGPQQVLEHHHHLDRYALQRAGPRSPPSCICAELACWLTGIVPAQLAASILIWCVRSVSPSITGSCGAAPARALTDTWLLLLQGELLAVHARQG